MPLPGVITDREVHETLVGQRSPCLVGRLEIEVGHLEPHSTECRLVGSESGRRYRHDRICVTGLEGAHVAQDQLFGHVDAVVLVLVIAASDGEGVHDVAGIISVKAIEDEVESVEAGPQVAALFHLPAEGFAVVTLGLGEGLKECLAAKLRARG